MKKVKFNFPKLDNLELEEIKKMWNSTNTIGSFSGIELIEFSKLILRSIDKIKNADNARLVILETWLILDFSIRELLRKGLDIKRFCDENFDPLPNGFRDCSLLLKNFINQQKSKPRNPYFLHSEICIPIGFREYFFGNKERLKEAIKIEEEYYKKHNLESHEVYNRNDNEFQNVNENWIKSIQKLDDKWFKHAEKINKIRNKAAHSIDEESIYIDAGINGKDKFNKLKKYCIESLSNLIGPNLNIQ